MMKTSVLLFLTAYSVHCNVISRYNQKDVVSSFLDAAVGMINKAKDYIPNGSNYPKIHNQKAVDCADVLEMGNNKSGIYEIWPISTPTSRVMDGKSIFVYCDMDTNGGGWTVIQRRGDFKTPKDYFYRNWKNYKRGFGNIEEDFWLGNDNIFALTNQKLYSVRFDLQDVEGSKAFAQYQEFWIDGEKLKYTVHIDLYSGDAGDSMGIHSNHSFSTFDKDNVNNCANSRKGGWWYFDCARANLNGLYYKGKNGNTNRDGLSWSTWKGYDESLVWTEIKIRPKHFRATFS